MSVRRKVPDFEKMDCECAEHYIQYPDPAPKEIQECYGHFMCPVCDKKLETHGTFGECTSMECTINKLCLYTLHSQGYCHRCRKEKVTLEETGKEPTIQEIWEECDRNIIIIHTEKEEEEEEVIRPPRMLKENARKIVAGGIGTPSTIEGSPMGFGGSFRPKETESDEVLKEDQEIREENLRLRELCKRQQREIEDNMQRWAGMRRQIEVWEEEMETRDLRYRMESIAEGKPERTGRGFTGFYPDQGIDEETAGYEEHEYYDN